MGTSSNTAANAALSTEVPTFTALGEPEPTLFEWDGPVPEHASGPDGPPTDEIPVDALRGAPHEMAGAVPLPLELADAPAGPPRGADRWVDAGLALVLRNRLRADGLLPDGTSPDNDPDTGRPAGHRSTVLVAEAAAGPAARRGTTHGGATDTTSGSVVGGTDGGARPRGTWPVRARSAGARGAETHPAEARPAGVRPAGRRPAGEGTVPASPVDAGAELRRPATGLAAALALGLLAAFFGWVSAAPFWLANGVGATGTATVTSCAAQTLSAHCTGAFTGTDGTTHTTRLAALAPADREPGATVEARTLGAGGVAYAGPVSGLHLRWVLGLALVLVCGIGVGAATGVSRLRREGPRRVAVLWALSIGGPVLVALVPVVAALF